MAQILIEVFATFILAIIIGCLCIAATAAEEVMVSMRDGVTIKTYVKTPSGKGQWPAVLVKGYGITTGGADSFVNAGYAYVAQGVRGESDPHRISGTPRFFADDVDGYDTIEWVARQPWCDGNVAMVGVSYYGATQWLAAAIWTDTPAERMRLSCIYHCSIWTERYEAAKTLSGTSMCLTGLMTITGRISGCAINAIGSRSPYTYMRS